MTTSRKIGKSAGNRGMGRPKGSRNKVTLVLKDAILEAAEQAGGKGGLVAYLAKQAVDTPGPFMALLGRILPRQITGDGGGPIEIEDTVQRDAEDFTRSIERLAAKYHANDNDKG